MKKYGLSTKQLVKRNILTALACFVLFYFECKFFGLAVEPWIAGLFGIAAAETAFFLIFRGKDSENEDNDNQE